LHIDGGKTWNAKVMIQSAKFSYFTVSSLVYYLTTQNSLVSLFSYTRGPGSTPGQSIWDLWWTELRCSMVLLRKFLLPVIKGSGTLGPRHQGNFVSSHCCSYKHWAVVVIDSALHSYSYLRCSRFEHRDSPPSHSRIFPKPFQFFTFTTHLNIRCCCGLC
jgi:hypothetical protein